MPFRDRRAAMAEKPDKDTQKGPGGMTMRELHELVKKGHARNNSVLGKPHNKLAQPQNRWQRLVRYVWDKNRGRG
jgi:hypothetical protein